jgi:hypothetical protein
MPFSAQTLEEIKKQFRPFSKTIYESNLLWEAINRCDTTNKKSVERLFIEMGKCIRENKNEDKKNYAAMLENSRILLIRDLQKQANKQLLDAIRKTSQEYRDIVSSMVTHNVEHISSEEAMRTEKLRGKPGEANQAIVETFRERKKIASEKMKENLNNPDVKTYYKMAYDLSFADIQMNHYLSHLEAKSRDDSINTDSDEESSSSFQETTIAINETQPLVRKEEDQQNCSPCCRLF